MGRSTRLSDSGHDQATARLSPRPAASVSILLPVHNAAAYLGLTLASLVWQTHTDFEVVAIDDGSSDSSGRILDDWASKDERFRVAHQKKCGLVETLNRAISLARSSLIARADADDIYHPERLERQIAYFASQPDVVLLGARTIKIDSRGRNLYHESQPLAHDEILRTLVAGFGGVIPHPVAMFRKSAALAVGGYRMEAQHCEDTDLWLRLSEVGRIANLPQHLVKYRVHHSSVSATQWQDRRADAQRVATEWARRNNFVIPANTFWNRPPQTKAWLARYWAGQALKEGNYAAALRESFFSLRHESYRPSSWKAFGRCLFSWLSSILRPRAHQSDWGAEASKRG